MDLVQIQNGKRGVPRLVGLSVLSTVYPIEFEKRAIKNTSYRNLRVVETVSQPFSEADLCEISAMDFIGWSFAQTKYILFIKSGFLNDVLIPPKHPISVVLDARQRFESNKEETLAIFSNLVFRITLIEGIRKLESQLSKSLLVREEKKEMLKLKALAYFLFSNYKENKSVYDVAALEKTFNYCREKVISIQKNIYTYDLVRQLKPMKVPTPPVEFQEVAKRIFHSLQQGELISFDQLLSQEKNIKPKAYLPDSIPNLFENGV
jgi:hypothetical protein